MPKVDRTSHGKVGRGKVCHLSSVHRVNDIRIYHKECATLAEAGFDVTLIGVAADVTDKGVNVIKLPDEGSRMQRFVSRGRVVFQKAVEVEAQVYHFHDPELLPFGLMLKRRTGAKVIFDSHECFREDVIAKHWIPKSLRVLVGRTVGAIEDYVVGRIDRVIAATPHIAETFEQHAKSVVTINNYPIGSEFSARPQASIQKRNAICYVGALTFVRGLIPLLDSLSFVSPDVEVHIAGTFASNAIEKAMKQHPNWSRVTFHGQVGRPEISRIFEQSFAGMVTLLSAPNHIHSKPIKMFEYMSAGMPVICSHFPLWRSVIEDGGCGLVVDPEDPRAIAAAIEHLRLNPKLGHQMAERGAQLVRDRYNWEHEGRRLVESYDELLAR